MARLCERPGCSAPAACVYGIDSKRLSVWIDGTVPDDAGSAALGKRAGVLCRRHADSMVVPIGWTLDDRRSAADAASAPATRVAPMARLSRTKVRRQVDDRNEQLALLDVPVDPSADAPLGRVDAVAGSAEAAVSPSAPETHVVSEAFDAVDAVVDVVEPAPDADPLPVEAALVAGAGSPQPDASVAGGPAAPWRPVFDQTDDLGGLLSTRSPLLARAFGKRDRSGDDTARDR